MNAVKKKRGRPRVEGRAPQNGQPILSCRVDRQAYAWAAEAAKEEGIPLAQWVRNALEGKILQAKLAQEGHIVSLMPTH